MVREDGTYPGPEELGRDAFAYSGARKTFEVGTSTVLSPSTRNDVVQNRDDSGSPPLVVTSFPKW